MDWPLSQGNNIHIKSHRCSLQIETYILTKRILVMLYNSLVLPHITYCNIVWGNSNQSKLNSILILQKKALRICTHSNYLAHTNPIFHELNILKLHDIHTYQTSICMFKHTVIYFHFFMMYLHIIVTYTHTPLAIVTIFTWTTPNNFWPIDQ